MLFRFSGQRPKAASLAASQKISKNHQKKHLKASKKYELEQRHSRATATLSIHPSNVRDIENIKDISDVNNVRDITDIQNIKDIEEITGVEDIRNIRDIINIKYIKDIRDVMAVRHWRKTGHAKTKAGFLRATLAG